MEETIGKREDSKEREREGEYSRAIRAIPEKAKLGTGVPLQVKRAFRVLLFSSPQSISSAYWPINPIF